MVNILMIKKIKCYIYVLMVKIEAALKNFNKSKLKEFNVEILVLMDFNV